ncbi:protein S100-A16-like [Vipera latastei]
MEGAKQRPTVREEPELEQAIRFVAENYNKYWEEGSKKACGIDYSNFQKMLKFGLNHMLTNTQEEELANNLIKQLDENGDGGINFDEYWNLIGEVAWHLSNQRKYEVEKKAGP